MATCRAEISVNMADEFDYGSGQLHADMSSLMTSISNANRQLAEIDLLFKDGEWVVQVEPARLLGVQ